MNQTTFKEINEAYEVLSDPEKRTRYDQLGSNWKAGAEFTPTPGWGNAAVQSGNYGEVFGGDHSPGGFSDFFESLFGNRGATRSGAGFQMRGQDVEAEIALTLEEAHRGGSHSINLQTPEPCIDCAGSGSKEGDHAIEARYRGEPGRDRDDSGSAGSTPRSRARESMVACSAVRSPSIVDHEVVDGPGADDAYAVRLVSMSNRP